MGDFGTGTGSDRHPFSGPGAGDLVCLRNLRIGSAFESDSRRLISDTSGGLPDPVVAFAKPAPHLAL